MVSIEKEKRKKTIPRDNPPLWRKLQSVGQSNLEKVKDASRTTQANAYLQLAVRRLAGLVGLGTSAPHQASVPVRGGGRKKIGLQKEFNTTKT